MRVFLEEYRRLIQVKGWFDGHNWLLRWDKGQVSITCSVERMAGILKIIKAKDHASAPRSRRTKTYRQVAQGIADGSDRLFWVWNNDLKKIRGFSNGKLYQGKALNADQA